MNSRGEMFNRSREIRENDIVNRKKYILLLTLRNYVDRLGSKSKKRPSNFRSEKNVHVSLKANV